MDLETCRYINLPGVGVIDLEASELPEKEYNAAAGRRSNEPTIMEMIASVSKALKEYERDGGFAPAATDDTEEVALAASAARVEPTEDSFALPHVDEGREASPPGPVEAAETPASSQSLSRWRPLLGKRRRHRPAQSPLKSRMSRLARLTSQPLPCKGWSFLSRWPGPPPQRSRWLELACSSWATTTGLDTDSEDDEEATTHHTLERGMTWARRAFDKLILPAT
jgi:hypothetical protein